MVWWQKERNPGANTWLNALFSAHCYCFEPCEKKMNRGQKKENFGVVINRWSAIIDFFRRLYHIFAMLLLSLGVVANSFFPVTGIPRTFVQKFGIFIRRQQVYFRTRPLLGSFCIKQRLLVGHQKSKMTLHVSHCLRASITWFSFSPKPPRQANADMYSPLFSFAQFLEFENFSSSFR